MTHSPELETTFEIVQRLSKAGGEPWEKFKALIAKFDPPPPPVEYDYPMPQWEEFLAKYPAHPEQSVEWAYLGVRGISSADYTAIRQAIKTPRKPAPKLGREFWVLNGITYVSKSLALSGAYGRDLKVIHVREVLDDQP